MMMMMIQARTAAAEVAAAVAEVAAAVAGEQVELSAAAQISSVKVKMK